MKVYYEENTGEIQLVSNTSTPKVELFSPLPYIEIEATDLSNKRVDTNTQTLIDKE